MIRIGIDFSINNPGITIRKPEGLTFYTFPREGGLKEDFIISLRKSNVKVVEIPCAPSLAKNASIATRERNSLVDSIHLTQAIMDVLQEECKNVFGNQISVAIEGFSFASSGNRLSQLSGYQWLLRYLIIEQLNVDPQNFHVFSPMTIKATAGKGNLKKDGMIQAFLDSEEVQLRETPLWNDLTIEPTSFQTKRGGWLKIDDIVDSYWVLKTLEKHVEPFEIS
jgi:hypothetical protein